MTLLRINKLLMVRNSRGSLDACDLYVSGQLGREESASAALTEFYSAKSLSSGNLDSGPP